MIKIKLYSNCILNENYQNVFCTLSPIHRGKSILEKYLETLNSSDEIELDYSYYQNSGMFVFSYDLEDGRIYDFNYMRIQCYTSSGSLYLTRYCFVNKIELKNDMVYLTYSEDIWSSYSKDIGGTTECMLTRSRVLNYENLDLSLHSLPIEYDGNNKLEIVEFPRDEQYQGKVKILLELQVYNLVSGTDNKQVRNTYYVEYCRVNGAPDYSPGTSTFNYGDAEEVLNEIVLGVSKNFVRPNNSTESFNFEIGDIYIIPADYRVVVRSYSMSSQKIGFYYFKETNDRLLFDYKGTFRILSDDVNGFLMKSFEIENDYKNLFFGTYSTPLKINNNGTSLSAELKGFVSKSNIAFYLSVGNQILDITNDFKYKEPFSSLSSSQFAQRSTNLQLQNLNINYQKNMNGINTAQKAIKSIEKAGVEFAKENAFTGLTNTVQAGLEIAKGVITNKKLNEEMALKNAPIYSNTNGIFGNSSNFINSFKGLLLFKIIPDNENYVKRTINNFGHKVYEFINQDNYNVLKINEENFFSSNNIYYNVLKFDGVDIFGNFGRDIATSFNSIFENGVKIWYNEQMIEDDYV